MVSGGSSPEPLYESLSRQPLDWSRVYVALVDERWVEFGHEKSNEAFVARTLCQNAGASANLVGMKNAAETPDEGLSACEEAYQQLAQPFDVTILGLGADGHPASLFPLATAVFYALIMLSARRIHGSEGIWTLMFYVVLFPTLFSGLLVPVVWQPLQAAHLPVFVVLAVFGTLGLTLISQAFRMASAAVVAPFEYTALLWATLLGWMIWNELPDHWTYIGAAVIIASGIYIIVRETARP
jgi:uncharacterized membrane protein